MAKDENVMPDEELIRKAVSGNEEAIIKIEMHYGKLIRCKLSREIQKMAGKTGFGTDMFQLEELYDDLLMILEKAIKKFRD